MADFLTFFDALRRRFPLYIEIYCNKIMDWSIYIFKKGCAKEYPNSEKDGDDAVLVSVGDGDMELCFAKAHVALKEWLMENEGGY